MPGRRQLRRGARDGHVDRRLAGALRAEITRLRKIADPEIRATEITELFAGLDGYLDEISEVRAQALVALHAKGWNLEALSELTGLSRSRVGRLVQLGRDNAKP